VSFAKKPITPPEAASKAAGTAKGRTQQTPQASAPIAANAPRRSQRKRVPDDTLKLRALSLAVAGGCDGRRGKTSQMNADIICF
jgi:hypothetical protein